MHADSSLADTQQLELPQDLVSALNSRAHTPRDDFGIEGMKPSLLGRLLEMLIGRPRD
ncbi:MAG TPA: hypothetical protein VMT29_23085 [Steroidobacteraceae bacterium]|nr:hypothetical protein [Steroidobacteraceae bacterium]